METKGPNLVQINIHEKLGKEKLIPLALGKIGPHLLIKQNNYELLYFFFRWLYYGYVTTCKSFPSTIRE